MVAVHNVRSQPFLLVLTCALSCLVICLLLLFLQVDLLQPGLAELDVAYSNTVPNVENILQQEKGMPLAPR